MTRDDTTDEDLEVANAKDLFFTRRDEQGELLPKNIPVPGRDTVIPVRPLPSGGYEKYFNGEVTVRDDDALFAEFATDSFPQLDVSEEDVADGLLSFSTNVMINMVHEASGRDMQTAAQSAQTREQVHEMMDMIGVDPDDADMDDMVKLMSAMQGMDLDEDDVEGDDEDGPSASDPNRPGGPELREKDPDRDG